MARRRPHRLTVAPGSIKAEMRRGTPPPNKLGRLRYDTQARDNDHVRIAVQVQGIWWQEQGIFFHGSSHRWASVMVTAPVGCA
jgi:hypothetical protein